MLYRFFPVIFFLIYLIDFALANSQFVQNKPYQKQSIDENYNVKKRAKPDYNPVGARLGQYMLYPSFLTNTEYSDSIYATDINVKDDIIFSLNPAIKAVSNFKNHSLNFYFSNNLSYYTHNKDENKNEFTLKKDGYLYIKKDFKLNFATTYFIGDEARGISEQGLRTDKPINYQQFNTIFGIEKDFNRFDLDIDFKYNKIDFSDSSLNGFTIDQDNRDFDIFALSNKLKYEFSPKFYSFIEIDINDRRFTVQKLNDLDSQGIKSILGLGFNIVPSIETAFYLGYLNQNYQHFKDLKTATYGTTLNYYYDPLLNFSASIHRNNNDSVFTVRSGKVQTHYNLGAAYEFRRNIVFEPYIGIIDATYIENSENEHLFYSGMETNYLLNRNLSLKLMYRYDDRESDIKNLDFKRNILSIGIETKL